MRLLLHPKITMAALVAGLASLGALFASVVTALAPLTSIAQLHAVQPRLLALVTTFGTISAVCLALAAVGRSISVFIDNNGKPPTQ